MFEILENIIPRNAYGEMAPFLIETIMVMPDST